MGVATIALAVGLTTLQSARTTVAGTLLPVSEADAAAYGISAVYQLDDGSGTGANGLVACFMLSPACFLFCRVTPDSNH